MIIIGWIRLSASEGWSSEANTDQIKMSAIKGSHFQRTRVNSLFCDFVSCARHYKALGIVFFLLLFLLLTA